MKETAQAVLDYFKENLLVMLVLALVAGFAARKTVVHGEKTNLALDFLVGLVGAFLGQFAILYSGLNEILDEVPAFRIFFDLIGAYIGSFVIAALINFVKPSS